MNIDMNQIYLEINTELFRDYPYLKPQGKASLNYWINKKQGSEE